MRESERQPSRTVAGLQPLAINQPIKGQAVFGNIVTTVYAAILREIQVEGEASRFVKVGRGLFAINPAIVNAPKAKKPQADAPKEAVPDPTERDIPDGTEGPEALKELFRI